MSDSQSENGQLSPRQVRAIESLLTTPTVRAAAEVSQVSEATLRRWRSEPTFEAAYQQARESAFSEGLQRLQSATGEAVATLRAVLSDVGAKPGERVSAARTLLEFALKARELFEIEARLATIEGRLGKAAA